MASATRQPDNAMELTRVKKHISDRGRFLVDFEGMPGLNDALGIYPGRIRVEQRAHRNKRRS